MGFSAFVVGRQDVLRNRRQKWSSIFKEMPSAAPTVNKVIPAAKLQGQLHSSASDKSLADESWVACHDNRATAFETKPAPKNHTASIGRFGNTRISGRGRNIGTSTRTSCSTSSYLSSSPLSSIEPPSMPDSSSMLTRARWPSIGTSACQTVQQHSVIPAGRVTNTFAQGCVMVR